jgi:hypothetical protein
MNYVIEKTERKKKLRKTNKKDIIYSVDCLHTEKMLYFKNLQEIVLPKKLKELEKYKKQGKQEIKIKELMSEINCIKDKKEEIDYFFKTSDILNKYYCTDNENENFDIVREYFNAINLEIPIKYREDLFLSKNCKNCNGEDCIVENEELSCTLCGVVNDRFISKVMSYKESQENYSYIPSDLHYKRLDYFKQRLNQIQGKEQTDIPSNVIDEIILQLQVERIKDISKISYELLRRLLKKTGNSKYYEHISFIKYKICGVKPLNIPKEIEEIFIIMFVEVEKIWSSIKSLERSSFFSNPYITHKFCQLLGLNEYLIHFPLLKSREKLYKQDIMWKKVIEIFNSNNSENNFIKDIDWVFISSI